MKTGVIIFIALLMINECEAQNSAAMNTHNIDYQHPLPVSFNAKLIQSILGLTGMKKKMEKRMISDGFDKEPAKPPKSLTKNFIVDLQTQNGRKIWTLSPKERQSDVVIVYLHGGAYMANISRQHWALIRQLADRTNAVIVVPDYPLAPEASCEEAYRFMDAFYNEILAKYPTKRIVFIGDSAGGGLALGFAQQLRNEEKKQPEQIILFSPWLDVSLNNPEIKTKEKQDKILSAEGLRNAGRKYAGDLDLQAYRVSPLYGDLTGLCTISVFTGTNDILNADARKLKDLMERKNLDFHYFEYPGMFHDWVIVPQLKESQHAISKACGLMSAPLSDMQNRPTTIR
jgi:acetyl esterase/lipase